MDVVLVGLPGERQERRRATARQSPWRGVHRPRRAHRVGRRAVDPGDLRRGRRGRVPGARTGGDRRPRPARPGARRPARDLDRWRRGRRSAQPVGALPRPDVGLARRPAGGPRPAPAPLAERPAAGHRARPDRDAARPRRAARAVLRRGDHPSRRASPRSTASSTRSRRGCRAVRAGRTGTTLLRAATPIGRIVLGDGIAADVLDDELDAVAHRARSSSASPAPGRRSASDSPTTSARGPRGRHGHAPARARPPSV